jgi:hypothetical protein
MLMSYAHLTRMAGILLATLAALNAQSVNPAVTVPRTVRYTGSFHPANGMAAQPVEGVTLAVYRDQAGGDPLWQETQNVQVDASGNFAVEMGPPRVRDYRWICFARENRAGWGCG